VKGMGGHQTHGNGANVWLTPPGLIEKLGPFDLDPCFGEPRPWATAEVHYGPEDNGLSLRWHGLVWCNPPYDRDAGAWLRRMAEHRNGIALIFARTETAVFHELVFEQANAALFLRGRLHFHHPDGRRAAHNAGAPSVLVAYGGNAVERLLNADIAGRFVRLEVPW